MIYQGLDKNKLRDDERFVLIEGPQVSMTYSWIQYEKSSL